MRPASAPSLPGTAVALMPPVELIDDPAQWLGCTEILDLEDPKLRLRAQSISQLCKDDRDKALALYGYVKRMPVSKPLKLKLRTARQVMDAGRGDAEDKASLLVALLRSTAIPSRLRYVEVNGIILRGLVDGISSFSRPLVEVWIRGQWLRTDTFIFEATYMAAALRRLQTDEWDCGYGIHRGAQTIWNGAQSAYLGGVPSEQDPLVVAHNGVFHDHQHYTQSPAFTERHPRFARSVLWNVLSPGIQRVMRELREDGKRSLPPSLREPSKSV